jgi:shikimate 5-dehydrogenase
MSDKYAVVGNPIDHTKSPLIHLSFAKETGQDIDYVAIEAPIGGFNEVVAKFRRTGGLGLNTPRRSNWTRSRIAPILTSAPGSLVPSTR